MTGMRICEFLWMAFFVVWVIWAIRTKPTKRGKVFRHGCPT